MIKIFRDTRRERELDSNFRLPSSSFSLFLRSSNGITGNGQVHSHRPHVANRQHGSIAWVSPTWQSFPAICNQICYLQLKPWKQACSGGRVQFLMKNSWNLRSGCRWARSEKWMSWRLRFRESSSFLLIRSIDVLCMYALQTFFQQWFNVKSLGRWGQFPCLRTSRFITWNNSGLSSGRTIKSKKIIMAHHNNKYDTQRGCFPRWCPKKTQS